ncbi:MAG: hypothetical protein COA77_04970 [Thaumarchaeota archaeon]|jgi:hypothetical protein|nr:MAG: hypothetical protein COA77_04970 [Nitrososphaerota archaeon]
MEKSIEETTVLEKPIQDRLRQASHITVESALRNKVSLNISWYDIHGEQQNQKYTIAAGTMIEF